ncbi:MAG: hypothetical protein KGD74_03450 [Candidatus Lokiarchaeota archaeon]|nr:hypothetical protein [Candidatus Lokiarchaeota archaeon]
MLNQISPTRIILVFGLQPVFVFFFLYIAYLIFKRKITQATKVLLIFYILTGFGLIFNMVAVLITLTKIEWISFLSYAIMSYFVFIPQIFLVLFILKLLNNPVGFNKKKQNIYFILFCIITLLIIMIPGGITVNESTNWAPRYSWVFLIIVYIFYSSFIFIPILVNLIKLLKTFEDKSLRRRLLLFSYGTIGVMIGVYGAALYNAWDEPTYRLIWSLIQLFLIPTSSLLIYYGIGKNL